MNRSSQVLLISDSRGRGIAPRLQGETFQDSDITWEEIVLPGATLEIIFKRLERIKRRSNKWDLIIIIGGICNFTNRVSKRQQNYLEYKTRNINGIKLTIDQILETFGTQIHIATITPASLSKYSNYRNEDPTIEKEQEDLLEDIESVNRHIIERNISRDSPTFDLAKQCYTSKLKKQGPKKKRVTKFTHTKLRDGVHPDESLKDTWAMYMASVAAKIISKREEPSAENPTEDSDSEQEQEAWNFKRR